MDVRRVIFRSSDLSRRRHTRSISDWSSDVCSSDRSEEHTSELQSLIDLVCRLIRSKEHTSELQSLIDLVCRLLLEKKKDELSEQSPRWRTSAPSSRGLRRCRA